MPTVTITIDLPEGAIIKLARGSGSTAAAHDDTPRCSATEPPKLAEEKSHRVFKDPRMAKWMESCPSKHVDMAYYRHYNRGFACLKAHGCLPDEWASKQKLKKK